MVDGTDGELVERARHGDRDAYGTLITRYQNPVYAVAYSLAGRWEDAQDIAQEVFLRAYLNLAQLRDPSRFAAWLRRVTHGVAVNWLKARGTNLRDRLGIRIALDDLEIPDAAPDPAAWVEQQESAQAVQRAIASLPARYRVPLTMFHLDGLSYQRVACFLDIPVGTAKSLISRAGQQLRTALTPHYTEEIAAMAGKLFDEHRLTPEFTKQVLDNIHNLVTWHHGQNYLFNGCMHYLMECLQEDRAYDYWFFSGVTGDSFTQLYRTGGPEPVTCLSQDTFDSELARLAFDACGYDFLYMSEPELRAHPMPWRRRIVASIDAGRPVITNGFEGTGVFAIICGYDHDGDVLLALKGDDPTPTASPNGLRHSTGLLFVGAKKQAPPMPEVYRRTVARIPAFVSRSPQNGLVFGRSAFEAWADGLLGDDILFTDQDEAAMTALRWRLHCAPLCIAGTNGCARGFLQQARVLCPELSVVPLLQPVYERMQSLFEEIQQMQGGFWIPFDTLRDRGMRRRLSIKIREFGPCCDEILALTQAL